MQCAMRKKCDLTPRNSGQCVYYDPNSCWAKPVHECCCATNGQCPNKPAVKCRPRKPAGWTPPEGWPHCSPNAVAPDESYIVNETTEHPVGNNDLDPLLFEGAIAVLAMVMIAVVVIMTRRWRRKKLTKKNKIVEIEMDKVDVDAAENSEEANELLNDHDEHDQN